MVNFKRIKFNIAYLKRNSLSYYLFNISVLPEEKKR